MQRAESNPQSNVVDLINQLKKIKITNGKVNELLKLFIEHISWLEDASIKHGATMDSFCKDLNAVIVILSNPSSFADHIEALHERMVIHNDAYKKRFGVGLIGFVSGGLMVGTSAISLFATGGLSAPASWTLGSAGLVTMSTSIGASVDVTRKRGALAVCEETILRSIIDYDMEHILLSKDYLNYVYSGLKVILFYANKRKVNLERDKILNTHIDMIKQQMLEEKNLNQLILNLYEAHRELIRNSSSSKSAIELQDLTTKFSQTFYADLESEKNNSQIVIFHVNKMIFNCESLEDASMLRKIRSDIESNEVLLEDQIENIKSIKNMNPLFNEEKEKLSQLNLGNNRFRKIN